MEAIKLRIAIASSLSRLSNLHLLFVAKTDALTIAGYMKALLVLKEMQKSGEIEIVAFQGLKSWIRSL